MEYTKYILNTDQYKQYNQNYFTKKKKIKGDPLWYGRV